MTDNSVSTRGTPTALNCTAPSSRICPDAVDCRAVFRIVLAEKKNDFVPGTAPIQWTEQKNSHHITVVHKDAVATSTYRI